MNLYNATCLIFVVFFTMACSAGSLGTAVSVADENTITDDVVADVIDDVIEDVVEPEISVLNDMAPQDSTSSAVEPTDEANSSNANIAFAESNLFDSNIELSGVVYTESEAELFWTRSSAIGISAYLIKRDNVELATLDALSFYDNTVQAGTTYEYTVQAVNENGDNGTLSSLFLTTPEAAPTISESNAESLIAQAIAVMQGRHFQEIIDHALLMQDVLNGDTATDAGFIEQSNSPGPDGVAKTCNCESGGAMEGFISSNALPNYSGTLAECGVGLQQIKTFSGDFNIDRSLSKFVFNSGIATSLGINKLSLTDAQGGLQEVSGEYQFFPGSNSTSWVFIETTQTEKDELGQFVLDENGGVITSVEPFTYLSPAFEGRTQIDISQIVHQRGQIPQGGELIFRHTLMAEFSMQSPATGNKTITVTTPVEFMADSEGNNFKSGQLVLTARDGSELLLDADTGDQNTALLSVLSDGIRVSNAFSWTEKPIIADIHSVPFPEDE